MKKFIIALVLPFVLVACGKFLDQPIKGQQNLDIYFQDEREAENFVTGCYSTIFYNDWWQIGKFWNMTDMCTDDCWMGNTAQDQSDYYSIVHCLGSGQSNEAVANFWQYRYKGILRCNVAIARIPEANMANEELKNRFIAEARFLRAFYYFDLVRNFGGVPLIKELLMPDQIEGVKRADASRIYEFVESELEMIVDILPQKSEYKPTEMGRATRGAALSLLGKVYLYQEKWEEASFVLEKVISENQYDLLENFGDVWSVDFNNSKESIFEVQYMYNETYNVGGFFSILNGSRSGPGDGWAWCLPTSNLEKAFIDAGDTERLKWTIIKHGDTEIAGVSPASFKENVGQSVNISPTIHKSGRVSRKVFIPFDKRPDPYAMGKLTLNHRIIRFADVLLMYAEAENMLGHDDNARSALNRVRNRVSLKDVESSGAELREAIRLERRLELALEQNRLFDIRRWKDNNGKPVICNLMGPNGTFVQYNAQGLDEIERQNSGEPSDKGVHFLEERDCLFPIPLYEITMSNGSIEQNPYWN